MPMGGKRAIFAHVHKSGRFPGTETNREWDKRISEEKKECSVDLLPSFFVHSDVSL